MVNLLSRVGDRRQETGDRRQEKWLGSEEIGVRIVRMIFLPNYEPKICSIHERFRRDTRHFLKTSKRLKTLFSSALKFHQQALSNVKS